MKDDRLISLNAAIDALDKVAEMFPYRIPGNAKTYRQYNEAWSDAIDAAENALEALPTVDAVPVVHGRWIYHPDWQADGECGYECSVCGMGSDVDYQFCMRCGAKMDGKEGDQNG